MIKLVKFLLPLLVLLGCNSNQQKENTKPNFIIIFTDDQGYQDLGCFGSPKIKTPNIDKMADGGIKFTDFYVSTSVCSASRASLLTGRRPARHGVGGVFFPGDNGLDSSEVTIAEHLKDNGYATACYGKWHLGDLKGHMPTDQGFDEYFGIPYSNDMYIGPEQTFSDTVKFREDYTLEKALADQKIVIDNPDFNKVFALGLGGKAPLLDGIKIVEYPAEQSTLTERYINRAINFIEKNKANPFFLYITPAMPHVPLYASSKFIGTSERGLYGDVIEEIDYNVGRLVNYLKENNLDKNTLIVFTSDNGPWLEYNELAGSAEPLRGGKFTNFEGGVREPTVMYWPGKIPAHSVSKQVASTLDLFPTLSSFAGISLPRNIAYDGMDISNHLKNPVQPIDRDVYYYNTLTEIGGIRVDGWKFLPQGPDWQTDVVSEPLLFNLNDDPSETENIYSDNPEKAAKLSEMINMYKESLK